jgi:hypothetical protein
MTISKEVARAAAARRERVLDYFREIIKPGEPIPAQHEIAEALKISAEELYTSVAALKRQQRLQTHRENGTYRARLIPGGQWSGFSELSANFGRNLAHQPLIGRNIKERECLGCRSNGRKTLVLGGPGQRLCESCKRTASDAGMSDSGSAGRRVGLSGFSVASQVQPRAA